MNIWITSVGLLSQVAHIILPGKLPLEFHLCTGLDPDQGHLEPRRNIPLLATYLFTLAVNILVPLRIRFSQHKRAKESRELNRNLTDLTTSLAIVISLGSLTTSLFAQYQIIPANLNIYPFYIHTYLVQIVLPRLVTLFVMLTYYYRNAALRTTIWRSFKESLSINNL